MYKVYFRLDFGPGTGYGHFARCKVLADLFLNNGSDVEFLVSESSRQSVINANLKSYVFTFLGDENLNLDTFVVSGQKSILVIDHYKLQVEFEALASSKFDLIVSIDDIGRKHRSHLLIDYFSGRTVDVLNKLNDSDGKILAGKDYALISPYFKKNIYNSVQKVVTNVLISLGSVEEDLYEKVLLAIKDNDQLKLTVLGPISEKMRSSYLDRNIDFITYVDEVFNFYKKFDFVIGASGVAMMERIVQLVPGLNFICVDNQQTKLEFQDDGIHFFGGDLRSMSHVEVKNLIEATISDFETNLEPKFCSCGIDGSGAKRIFDHIIRLAN